MKKKTGSKVRGQNSVKSAEKARVGKSAREAALVRLRQDSDETSDLIEIYDGEEPPVTKRTMPSRRRMSRRTADFHEALKHARGKKLLIVIKGYPDPDISELHKECCKQGLCHQLHT